MILRGVRKGLCKISNQRIEKLKGSSRKKTQAKKEGNQIKTIIEKTKENDTGSFIIRSFVIQIEITYIIIKFITVVAQLYNM